MGIGRPVNWKDMPPWFRVLFAVALLNFFSFWIVGFVNGGSALGGRIEGDKYFVVNHGKYTRVSKAFFLYSRIHTLSVFFTHPLAIGCGIWLSLRRSKKR
jgi:hypothetical protein